MKFFCLLSEPGNLFVCFAKCSRDAIDRDALAALLQGRPLLAMLVTPLAQLPLVFGPVLLINGVHQIDLSVGQMIAARFFDEGNLMVLAVADELLPTAILQAPQAPGVDEVEELARDRTIGQGKIGAADHRNATPCQREPVEQVNKLNQ